MWGFGHKEMIQFDVRTFLGMGREKPPPSGIVSIWDRDKFQCKQVSMIFCRVLKGGVVQGEGVFLGNPKDSGREDWGLP